MASLTSAAVATSDEARGRVEAEIAAWAASAQGRPLYEKYRDRRAYNHEICHRLAAAGVPPLAAAVLSGLPITLVFLLAQKWIVSGLTAGGVKG